MMITFNNIKQDVLKEMMSDSNEKKKLQDHNHLIINPGSNLILIRKKQKIRDVLQTLFTIFYLRITKKVYKISIRIMEKNFKNHNLMEFSECVRCTHTHLDQYRVYLTNK